VGMGGRPIPTRVGGRILGSDNESLRDLN
jgi:hypothetical protein